NIRELENVIERAVVLAEENTLKVKDLPVQLLSTESPRQRKPPETILPKVHQRDKSRHVGVNESNSIIQTTVSMSPQTVENNPQTLRGNGRKPDHVEREELRDALEQCGGNKAQAARLLGMPRSTFFSKLKRYGLT
ncbi:MAG: hypothetical protein KDA84_12085, partial [Planctomycetaceae bacterium]|nr:hypothetical protein [Planctomycetaceae bacterium]